MSTPPTPAPGKLLLALALFGALLTATVIPAVYTIDENNYLSTVVALRHGGLSLPGTEGLPPSYELSWFDPWPKGRAAATPVMTVAPPLYALMALPFSYLGWRGLVGLNTLAFLISVWLVYRFAATRPHESPWTPALAAALFALGSFNLEYAQGLWPHLLSVALCLGGFVLASRTRWGGPLRLAFLGGLLIGLACGVRYQSIAFAGWVGLGLVAFAPRRFAAAACFAAGLAPPLALSAILNQLRAGSYHPVSKGAGYATLPRLSLATDGPLLPEPLRVLWAKVIDFASHPPIAFAPLGPSPTGEETLWAWNPDVLGAFLWHGGLKKAWLQSSPWLLLALLAMALAWRRSGDHRQDRRAISLVVGGMLVLFAWMGFGRHDGLAFNQRYFLELVPLAAIALAWCLDGPALAPGPLARGAALGGLIALPALLSEPGSFVRSLLLLKAPLVLGVALALAWLASRRGKLNPAIPITLAGACLSWSLAVHLGDDLRASRRLRHYSQGQTALLAEALPKRAALVSFGPSKDAAGPLLLERDLVVVDALPDAAADTPALVAALLRSGRPVFVDLARFPPALFERVRQGLQVREVIPGAEPIVELSSP